MKNLFIILKDHVSIGCVDNFTIYTKGTDRIVYDFNNKRIIMTYVVGKSNDTTKEMKHVKKFLVDYEW